ncbi:hypothetical protein L3C95_15810 [Chitinophaga filiformis]|uniref:hypothetical protein n=1 Tax=Chitinophaga filiformis TaxID=104663 RepID=UPI001F1F8099|nr:hypothetical protein [Chitinophaga filiformis]MCF6404363.1 hypothetical protein [Chitinophaga filiformis]
MTIENCFFIDKITDCIEEIATGIKKKTILDEASKKDIRDVLKKRGWIFNWKFECDRENSKVFKLMIRGDTVIQGLACLEIKKGYIEMHLLESAPQNLGPNKKYAGVAGNLVAFACKTSFDLGFEGHIAFTAKTQLVKHYMDTLGAEIIYGRRLGIFTPAARKLVNSYFKDYFNGK